MASRPFDCDRNCLQLSLEDRLSDAQQAELADHLESCLKCRQELERMAAASKYWAAAALLGGEPAQAARPAVGIFADGARVFEGEDEIDDLDAGVLEMLDPPDPARPETVGRLGSYEILEVLGRGGMGVVLKARDPALDRTVAIKVLTPALAHGATARRRFAREARAVAAVGHEHIVAIYAVDEFRGLPYLVMQYVPGRSLQERLDASGPLEVREILRIGTQAARALAAAHAQGVVHRDIKPANILLENCVERVKLTDFGLARAIDDASLTRTGVIAGTPQYMAPEQARGDPVDARADLFALGAALYAMAAGRSPFRADSAMAVLKRVCDVRHRRIRELNPDVPDWLEATIDRLLAKEPADRFQTAAEVADLLERGLAHVQQPASLPAPMVRGPDAPGARALDLERSQAQPLRRTLRHLPLAATLMLLTAAGLGVSEAAGLTQVSDFVATVLRVKTPDGTLVVKCSDPGVKVQVDGQDLVITGTGPHVVRLRTGVHRLAVIKDGRTVRDELVSITRGGKELVNVALEPTEKATAAETKDQRTIITPSSHVNQCMICHGNNHTLKGDEPLPAKHPSLDYRPHAPISSALPGPGPYRLPGDPRPMMGRRWWRRKHCPFGSGRSATRPARVRSGLSRSTWPPLRLRSAPDPCYGARAPAHAGRVIRPGTSSAGSGLDLESRLLAGRCRLAIGQQGIDRPESILRVWDLAQGKDAAWFQQPAGYRSVAFSSDGRTFAAGLFDGILTTFEIHDEWKIHHSENQGSPINALVFLPHSTIVAAGDWDGWVRFHGPDSMADRCPLKYSGKIWSLAVSPDGSMLAVGGEAKTIQVYDLATRQHKVTLNGHNHAVKSLDFSPDGKLLAAAGGPIVRLWNTATWDDGGGEIQHHPEVVCVRFAPDGKLLAISDGESDLPHYKLLPTAIILWDVATREAVRWLRGHTNTIWALAFSPDGKTLASGSADQTVKFWDTASGQLRETIVPGESGSSSGSGLRR